MKHFTLLELGADSESPMIGTLHDVADMEDFARRFPLALREHFDVKEFTCGHIPNLFCGTPYEDFSIEIEGHYHDIRVLETWSY